MSDRVPEPTVDPRDIVTETAFKVQSDLLGVPIASPWRRGAAFALDSLIAAIVNALGGAGVAAAVLSILTFRFLTRGARGFFGAVLKGTFAFPVAFIVFAITFGIFDDSDPEIDFEGSPEELARLERVADAVPGLEVPAMPSEPPGVLGGEETASPEEDPSEDPQAGEEEQGDAPVPVDPEASATPEEESATTPDDPADELEESVLEAMKKLDLASEDPEAQAAIAKAIGEIGKEIAEGAPDRSAEQRIKRLEDENERLRDEVDSFSFIRVARGVASDVGLTFGWVGFYFTLFTAFWNGYTPGKRLLGIRVRRLDGKRFTLWSSFERFGGYAAGVATGLLGFAQVFWDANRQAIHDKISATVVVHEEFAAAAIAQANARREEAQAQLLQIRDAMDVSLFEQPDGPELLEAPDELEELDELEAPDGLEREDVGSESEDERPPEEKPA